jgi:hypothetical protein
MGSPFLRQTGFIALLVTAQGGCEASTVDDCVEACYNKQSCGMDISCESAEGYCEQFLQLAEENGCSAQAEVWASCGAKAECGICVEAENLLLGCVAANE